MSAEIKLSLKEEQDIAIQAGLQLIPYIGGSLATLYYGTKQEKRFKRLESFYQEFSEYISKSGHQFRGIDEFNKDELVFLIEELNEKVEREHTEAKRDFLKQFLLSTLSQPKGNFDEQRFFLDAVSDMTFLECDILALLRKALDALEVGSIRKDGVEQYAIVGAIGRLKGYGFIRTFTTGMSFGGREDNSLRDGVELTPFGKKFIAYCLN
ncbi:hypothetical protein [Paenibacillus solani]|uniref:hypothetical protein n=1 Tax=Paenibacillus solani TaxID=1705565 RepID=UPI003D2E1B0D